MSRFKDLREMQFQIFAPPTKLLLSDWADTYRKLSAEASSEPGQWITSRAEYQRGIMDAMNDATITQISVMKSAQVGWTEILLNAAGYFAHQDPSPILLVQPTLSMGQDFSKDRLAPMIRDTPSIAEKFSAAGSKSGENTLLHKTFAGGHLTIAGANSAAGLASRPIRVVLFDEIDRYPASAGTEGDPVSLGRKRAKTFWNRVIMLGSTPTDEGSSRIEKEYAKSDQRKYYVKCPHCGDKAPFDITRFASGTVESLQWFAGCLCLECGTLIDEKHKARMIRHGEWVATAESNGHAGFSINEFYSPWSSWGEIKSDYLAAKTDREQLKAWVNTSLGIPFTDSFSEIDPTGISKRAENYDHPVPEGVTLLTAGVDVQKDRWEIHVWGWNGQNECWFIHREVLYGDPKSASEWKRLDNYLMSATFESPEKEMQIVSMCIDSGYRSTEVYAYTATRYSRRFYAIKGYADDTRPYVTAMAKPKITGKKPPRMFALGVDTIRGHLHGLLATEDHGQGYVHFPNGMEVEFYEQLVADRPIIKYVKGIEKRVWSKHNKQPNEAGDCWVYAYAALKILNPIWAKIEKPEVIKVVEVPKTNLTKALSKNRVRPNKRKSFANRW